LVVAAAAAVVAVAVLAAPVRVSMLYVLVLRGVLLLLGVVELEHGCKIHRTEDQKKTKSIE